MNLFSPHSDGIGAMRRNDVLHDLVRWRSWRPFLPPHHPAGPSRLGPLSLCPASLQEAQGLTRESPEAEWSRDMHDASFSVGLPPSLGDFERLMIERAKGWIARESEGADELYFETFVLVEDPSTGELVTYGTADVLAFWYGHSFARVLDLKFYRTPISEESLVLQTASYAAPFLRRFNLVETKGYNPIADTTFGTEYKSTDLDSILARNRETHARGRDPQAVYRPSVEACTYCAAVGRCKAARAELGLLAGVVPVAGLELAKQKDVVEAVAERVKALDPAAILRSIDLAKLGGIVSDAVLAEAKEILREGAECDGWELQRRAGRRFFRSTTEAREALVVPGGLSQKEFDACCSVAVGEAEKRWKAAAGTPLEQQAGHAIERGDDTYALTRRRKAIR